MNRIVGSLAALALATLALPAVAQPKAVVWTLKPVEIYGRVPTPVAAVEVTKATAKLAPAPLRQPLLERIEETVHSTAL